MKPVLRRIQLLPSRARIGLLAGFALVAVLGFFLHAGSGSEPESVLVEPPPLRFVDWETGASGEDSSMTATAAGEASATADDAEWGTAVELREPKLRLLPSPKVSAAAPAPPIQSPCARASVAKGPTDEPVPVVVETPPEVIQSYDLSPSPAPSGSASPVAASPSPSLPPRVPGTVMLVGRVFIGTGDAEPLADLPVSLVRLASRDVQETRTDDQGRFRFGGLDPRGVYYVVAQHVHRYEDGLTYDYRWGWDPLRGSYGYVPFPVPRIIEERCSWHQAVIPTREGTWSFELRSRNADPEYCQDRMPTNDPVLRTPYRSWRNAKLAPVAEAPPRTS